MRPFNSPTQANGVRFSRRILCLLPVLASGLILSSAGSLTAAEMAAAKPSAKGILKEMSAKLATAKEFTFKAHRQMDPGVIIGKNIAESANVEVAVERPNKIAGKSTSKADIRSFYADGKRATLYDEKMDLYSTVPAKGSIDDVIEMIESRYGFTPPLAEFVTANPYKRILGMARTSTYAGQEKVDGVLSHHLEFKGKVVDADLWVSVSSELPVKLVVTFKDDAKNPQMKIDFSDWNLNANLSASQFTFVPSKTAAKVVMRTTEEMKAGKKTPKLKM